MDEQTNNSSINNTDVLHNVDIVILAGGRGTRMRSKLPKILHRIGGKPLLTKLIETSINLSPKNIFVVYGKDKALLQATVQETIKSSYPLTWVEQPEAKGTADAVKRVLPHFNVGTSERVLILYADVPLVSEETLLRFIQKVPMSSIGVITAEVKDPAGFGRIKRDEASKVTGIVEEKDATWQEKQIKEINTGMMLVPLKYLPQGLQAIKCNNNKREYYLTDIIAWACVHKIAVQTVQPKLTAEIQGVNDKYQLVDLERYYQYTKAMQLLEKGVLIKDPKRFDLRGELSIGRDVSIDINVILEGEVAIEDGCIIEANCILRNVTLGKNVKVLANSYLEGAIIEDNVSIGPFARVRPETHIKMGAKIGNFVEIKQSEIGAKSKVGHLAYIGNASLGQSVNIGAGVITCNYDGKHKHHTSIKDHAFIGSNSALIAPITVEEGAIIGAGTTLLKDAPANQVTLNKTEQHSKQSNKLLGNKTITQEIE